MASPKHVKLLALAIWRSLESPSTPVQLFTVKSVYDKRIVPLAHTPDLCTDMQMMLPESFSLLWQPFWLQRHQASEGMWDHMAGTGLTVLAGSTNRGQ